MIVARRITFFVCKPLATEETCKVVNCKDGLRTPPGLSPRTPFELSRVNHAHCVDQHALHKTAVQWSLLMKYCIASRITIWQFVTDKHNHNNLRKAKLHSLYRYKYINCGVQYEIVKNRFWNCKLATNSNKVLSNQSFLSKLHLIVITINETITFVYRRIKVYPYQWLVNY